MSKQDEKPDLVWREFRELKPHPMNSNTHPAEQIDSMASMLERLGDGKIQISVQKNTDLVMTGHGLIKSMKQEGHTGAWVIEKDYDDATALAWMEADNQYQKLSVIDKPTQLANLVELKRIDVELQPLGFELKAIETLKREVDNRVVEEDDPPTVSEEEPIAQTGDLWHLGEHRVLCGDSTRAEDVERVMDGEKAVLMATDPPYGDSWVQKAKDMAAHGYVHSRAVLHGSIESDDLNEADLKTFLDQFLATTKLAGDPPFPIYVWHGAKRMIFEQALIDAGYLVHQPVIWVKPGFVIGRLHYHPRCEWALHGWLQGNGKCPFYGERNQSDVWLLDRENDKVHPTQKPVELFAIPMRNHTVEGAICYDPFLGSGTTLIAADQLDRICYGLEIAPRYVDVVVKRYIKHRESSDDVWVERGTDRITWEQISRTVKVI